MPPRCIVGPLTDRFEDVGFRGDIEQPLIRIGVLHHCGGLGLLVISFGIQSQRHQEIMQPVHRRLGGHLSKG